MKSIYYICYKILNNFCLKFLLADMPLLMRFSTLKPKLEKNICFDFTHPTSHLGDRLFFVPLIASLYQSGIHVRLPIADIATRQLLSRIYGIILPDADIQNIQYQYIFPAPSLLSFIHKYKNLLVVNFTDTSCKNKITEQLIFSFEKLYNVRIPPVAFSNYLIGSKSNGNIYLFNNYIESGRFRKFFISEQKLIVKAANLKNQGYTIIHVGAKHDKESDKRTYPFVDVDLRGETSIEQLIDMVKSENVVGAITYDNFLMHLVGMYGKIAYVLFRGRFTRKNREHHMLHVNNTFFEQEEKLIYL